MILPKLSTAHVSNMLERLNVFTASPPLSYYELQCYTFCWLMYHMALMEETHKPLTLSLSKVTQILLQTLKNCHKFIRSYFTCKRTWTACRHDYLLISMFSWNCVCCSHPATIVIAISQLSLRATNSERVNHILKNYDVNVDSLIQFGRCDMWETMKISLLFTCGVM